MAFYPYRPAEDPGGAVGQALARGLGRITDQLLTKQADEEQYQRIKAARDEDRAIRAAERGEEQAWRSQVHEDQQAFQETQLARLDQQDRENRARTIIEQTAGNRIISPELASALEGTSFQHLVEQRPEISLPPGQMGPTAPERTFLRPEAAERRVLEQDKRYWDDQRKTEEHRKSVLTKADREFEAVEGLRALQAHRAALSIYKDTHTQPVASDYKTKTTTTTPQEGVDPATVVAMGAGAAGREVSVYETWQPAEYSADLGDGKTLIKPDGQTRYREAMDAWQKGFYGGIGAQWAGKPYSQAIAGGVDESVASLNNGVTPAASPSAETAVDAFLGVPSYPGTLSEQIAAANRDRGRLSLEASTQTSAPPSAPDQQSALLTGGGLLGAIPVGESLVDTVRRGGAVAQKLARSSPEEWRNQGSAQEDPARWLRGIQGDPGISSGQPALSPSAAAALLPAATAPSDPGGAIPALHNSVSELAGHELSVLHDAIAGGPMIGRGFSPAVEPWSSTSSGSPIEQENYIRALLAAPDSSQGLGMTEGVGTDVVPEVLEQTGQRGTTIAAALAEQAMGEARAAGVTVLDYLRGLVPDIRIRQQLRPFTANWPGGAPPVPPGEELWNQPRPDVAVETMFPGEALPAHWEQDRVGLPPTPTLAEAVSPELAAALGYTRPADLPSETPELDELARLLSGARALELQERTGFNALDKYLFGGEDVPPGLWDLLQRLGLDQPNHPLISNTGIAPSIR